jgi:hypothetical protein
LQKIEKLNLNLYIESTKPYAKPALKYLDKQLAQVVQGLQLLGDSLLQSFEVLLGLVTHIDAHS